jgi:hypothetical protein
VKTNRWKPRTTRSKGVEVVAMRRFLAPVSDRTVSDGIRGPSHCTEPSLEQLIAGASRVLLIGAVAVLGGTAIFAAAATVEGVNALPNAQPSVGGTLAVTPGKENSQSLDFALMRVGESKAITKYDVELTKQLHVIAVSDDFTTFLHDHVTRAAKDGHFRLNMAFPRPGLYHVYADSTPSGLGQQVLRFDLPVGTTQAGRTPPALRATGLEGSDGPYAVKFDALDLAAGQEATLTLHVEKAGKPAADLHPFLGVAAHAVFIDTADLSYLHAHASPASVKPVAAAASHQMEGMHGLHGTGDTHGIPGMHDMSGVDMAHTPAMPASAKVGSDLSLHVKPAKAGNYALWIQFIGEKAVRTVAFGVTVK